MSDAPVIRPLTNPIGRRRAAIEIHAHLRELLLQGELPPGMVMAQTEVARALGVGVIPVREAFRMLQQEGLIEAKPNQRAIVARLDPSEQDALWARRVLLESLASRMSAGRLSESELKQVDLTLEKMRSAASKDDYPAWTEAHYEFHKVANKFAGSSINAQIRSLTDQTLRYMLLHSKRLPHSYDEAITDHGAVLKALSSGDPELAQVASAIHVGRPALVLLAQLVPSFEPRAVRSALELVGVNRSERR